MSFERSPLAVLRWQGFTRMKGLECDDIPEIIVAMVDGEPWRFMRVSGPDDLNVYEYAASGPPPPAVATFKGLTVRVLVDETVPPGEIRLITE